VKWKVLDIYTRAGNKNGDRNDAKVSDLWSKKTTRVDDARRKKKKILVIAVITILVIIIIMNVSYTGKSYN
jgi:uncharacterized membrane protein YvbJ